MTFSKLISIGNAALDIYLDMDDSLDMDDRLDMEHRLAADDRLDGGCHDDRLQGSASFFPGGCAVNVARACAMCGVRAALWGPVGDDPFGKILSSIAAGGTGKMLDVRLKTPACPPKIEGSPGVAGSIRTGSVHLLGPNRFQTYNGANGYFAGPDLCNVSLTNASAVCLAGLAFLPSLDADAIRTFSHRLAEAEIPLFMAPGPIGRSRYLEIENSCSIAGLFVNRAEARRLCGSAGNNEVAAWGTARAAAGSMVVVTDSDAGGEFWSPGMHTRFAAQPVEAIDPLGAGDTFCGAFLAAGLKWGFLKKCRSATPGDLALVNEILASAAAEAAITCGSRGGCPSRGFISSRV